MSSLPNPLPDVEAQCRQLADLIRPQLSKNPALVGIYSGGAWIAERLKELLGLTEEVGLIDVSFYRDDFSQNGLHPQVRPSALPFEIEGQHLVLIDDVLMSGRTIRAALNELFDYGRPASVRLAVLVDRGGRQLPVQADFAAARVALPGSQSLALARNEQGTFQFQVQEA